MNLLEVMDRSVPSFKIVTSRATGDVVVDENEDRVSLIISKITAGACFIALGDMNQTGNGIQLTDQNPSIVLSKALHGNLVRGPWFEASAAAKSYAVAQATL